MYFTKNCFFVALIIFAIAILSNLAIAQNNPAPPKPEPHIKRIAGLNAKFIVALISDG
ncbi:MAG: hypothetical protein LBF88_02030 [Planctomycetaceae bacterium]|jgi:hypothetical protein|nr:hypothetical protein [Planctomycetaceae bacterium]